MHRPPKRLFVLGLTALLLYVFGSSLWRLWEQDVFWQMRAGEELLSTHHFPIRDVWSYTVRGTPWYSTQWLSGVAFYAIYQMAGAAGLVAFRGLMAAATSALVVWALRDRPPAVILVVAALVHLAMVPRIQVRPDLFVLLAYAGAIVLWRSDASWVAKRIGTIGLVAAAANFHGGTAIFLAALGCVFSLSEREGWRHEIAPCLAIVLAQFLTPYDFKVVPYMIDVSRSVGMVIPNPDFRPLDFARLNAMRYGWWLIAWAVLTAFAWATVLDPRIELSGAYRDRRLIGLLLGLMTLLCFLRDRAVPYHAVLAAPLASAFLGQSAQKLGRLMLGVVGLFMLPTQLIYYRPTLGFGLNQALLPVGAAEFLAKERPAPNLIHSEGDGNYLLWRLREYPVFMDPRETIYREIEATYRDMVHDPALMRRVIERYHIRTALMPHALSRSVLESNGERKTALFALLPPSDWAVVYFDNENSVLVSRIPEHKDLIEREEYRLLRPDRPAAEYLRSARTPELDARYASEVDRCQKEHSWIIVQCAIAAARLRVLAGVPGAIREARMRLGSLRAAHPRNAELLVELKELAAEGHDTAAAEELERDLDDLLRDSR